MLSAEPSLPTSSKLIFDLAASWHRQATRKDSPLFEKPNMNGCGRATSQSGPSHTGTGQRWWKESVLPWRSWRMSREDTWSALWSRFVLVKTSCESLCNMRGACVANSDISDSLAQLAVRRLLFKYLLSFGNYLIHVFSLIWAFFHFWAPANIKD